MDNFIEMVKNFISSDIFLVLCGAYLVWNALVGSDNKDFKFVSFILGLGLIWLIMLKY